MIAVKQIVKMKVFKISTKNGHASPTGLRNTHLKLNKVDYHGIKGNGDKKR